MLFTEEDYRKIEKWFMNRTVRDTQFSRADSINGTELVPIIQDKINKVTPLYDIVKQVTNMEPYDFYNVTDKLKKYKLTLEAAVNSIPVQQRKVGLVITFNDANDKWNIYQFRGYSLQQWQSLKCWEDIITTTIKRYIDDRLLYPDEEDITSYQDGNRTFIKFKDRHPSEEEFIGTGTIILRRNIKGADDCSIDGEGTPVNILTQEMMNEKNVIYVIQYDFDLDGKIISVPEGCTLWFQGGSIKNGSLYLHDTPIIGAYEFSDMGNAKLFGTFKKGQIMTFSDDSYKSKEGAYFVKSTRPSSNPEVDDDELFYDINPDAYVTKTRQELRWWNGEEWVMILDITDYNELKSIINDLIDKFNLEIAGLYNYVKGKLAFILEEIKNIKIRIDNIEQEITNIKTTIENLKNEFNEFKQYVENKFGDIINYINTKVEGLSLLDVKDNGFAFIKLLPDEIYVKPAPPDPDPDPDPDKPDPGPGGNANVYCGANINRDISITGKDKIVSIPEISISTPYGTYFAATQGSSNAFYVPNAEEIKNIDSWSISIVSATISIYVQHEGADPDDAATVLYGTYDLSDLSIETSWSAPVSENDPVGVITVVGSFSLHE